MRNMKAIHLLMQWKKKEVRKTRQEITTNRRIGEAYTIMINKINCFRIYMIKLEFGSKWKINRSYPGN